MATVNVLAASLEATTGGPGTVVLDFVGQEAT